MVCILFTLSTWGIYVLVDKIQYLSKIEIEVEKKETKDVIFLNSVSKTWKIVMDIVIEIFCKTLWHLILLPFVVIFLHTIPLIKMNVHADSWSVITMIASTIATMFSNSQLTNKFKFIVGKILKKKNIYLFL